LIECRRTPKPVAYFHDFADYETLVQAAQALDWRDVDLQKPLTQEVVQDWVRRAARRAHVAHEGVPVLRHTFGSPWR
jgi:hypothetical protein